MDNARIYDIVYALAANDGREQLLFGTCAAAAREAFARSLAGEAFPELWLEIPLAGEPWLDFHSLTSYQDVEGTQAAFAGHGGLYADALAWFARQEPGLVRMIALSYDTSSGDVDAPAVQLLVNTSDAVVPSAFLEAAGRADLCSAYRGFAGRMPGEWYACYVGVFPGRSAASADSWVRVECIVGDACQHAYAEDPAVLRSHLAGVGFADVDERTIEGIRELARSSFPLELQFNVGQDGLALPVISASVRFQPGDWLNAEGQAALARLAGWMQEHGVADARCGKLAEAMFAKRLSYDGDSVVASCFPAFVKLRWRKDAAPDAKAYFMVQVFRGDES